MNINDIKVMYWLDDFAADLLCAADEGDLNRLNKCLLSADFLEGRYDEDVWGYAIHLAVQNGRGAVAEKLVETVLSKHINSYGSSMLNIEDFKCAIEKGHLDLVNRLLKFPEVLENIYNFGELLFDAAVSGHDEMVESLLRIEAIEKNATADGNNAIRAAYLNIQGDESAKYRKIVDRLLQIPAVCEYEIEHQEEPEFAGLLQLAKDATKNERTVAPLLYSSWGQQSNSRENNEMVFPRFNARIANSFRK